MKRSLWPVISVFRGLSISAQTFMPATISWRPFHVSFFIYIQPMYVQLVSVTLINLIHVHVTFTILLPFCRRS